MDESYHEGHGQFYKTFGVDREQGCTIIIRPDQYVSYVGPVDDVKALNHFFSAFMVPRGDDLGKKSKPEVIEDGRENSLSSQWRLRRRASIWLESDSTLTFDMCLS